MNTKYPLAEADENFNNWTCIQLGTQVLDKFRFGFRVASDEKIMKLITEPLSE